MKKIRRNLIGVILGAVAIALIAALSITALLQPTASAASTNLSVAVANAGTNSVKLNAVAAAPITDTTTSQQYLDSFLKSFADKLGVSQDKLNSAFSGAISDTADQAVKDGKLTQAQADMIKAATKDGFKGILSALPKAGEGFKGMAGQFGAGMQQYGQYLNPVIQSVATLLNTTPSDLEAKVMSGQSLASLAKAQNVDVQKLKDTIVSSIKAQIDTAVKDGKITQSQADMATQMLSAHLDDLINASHTTK